MRRLVAGPVAVLLGCLLLPGCTPAGPTAARGTAAAPPSPTAAATLSPQPGPPAAPARLDRVPAVGTVTVRPGPFDDRLHLSGTRLGPDGVDTDVTVVSDVSDVLALEVTADLYDASGALLGSTSARYAPEHGSPETGPPAETLHLHLPVDPSYAGRVAGAVLAVPVLVNE